MKFANIRAIIWDWNGTLLNDVKYCLDILNNLLIENNLYPITIEQYREIFTFPVKDYYSKAGFDFSKKSFEELGSIFMENYEKNKCSLNLFEKALDTLKHFHSKGIEQYLLSAYKQDNLEEMLEHFGIKGFFNKIKGLDNIYAWGKTELGISLTKEILHPKENILLIGDTIHDEEVAKEMNIKSIIISNGHQSAEKLHSNGSLVIEDIKFLKDFILPAAYS